MTSERIVTDLGPEFVPGRALEDLRIEFAHQSVYWKRRNEPAMSALFEALVFESLENGNLNAAMEDTVILRNQNNSDVSTSEIAGAWRATLFGDQLTQGNKPQFFATREEWLEPIREVANLVMSRELAPSEDDRAERLSINLLSDSVGTNPFTRATPDELLMQSLRERFPDGYRWLDVGSGMLEVPNQVLNKQQHPFPRIVMYRHHSPKDTHPRWIRDKVLTVVAKKLLVRDHLVNFCLAVDLTDPYRGDHAQKWSRGSLRGSELADPNFRNTYEDFAAKRHPKLEYKTADLTSDLETAALREQIGNNKFDIVTMSTVQHQLSPQERFKMDSNAATLLAPGGLIIKKDFAWVSKSASQSMHFYKHWHKNGRYRTFALDPSLPDLGWQEIFRARDSRCRELLVSTGKLAVNGSLVTISELMRES